MYIRFSLFSTNLYTFWLFKSVLAGVTQTWWRRREFLKLHWIRMCAIYNFTFTIRVYNFIRLSAYKRVSAIFVCNWKNCKLRMRQSKLCIFKVTWLAVFYWMILTLDEGITVITVSFMFFQDVHHVFFLIVLSIHRWLIWKYHLKLTR